MKMEFSLLSHLLYMVCEEERCSEYFMKIRPFVMLLNEPSNQTEEVSAKANIRLLVKGWLINQKQFIKDHQDLVDHLKNN